MSKKHTDFDTPRELLALWGGWGLGIFAWALHLAVSYGIVGWYCQHPQAFDPGRVSLGLNLLTLLCSLLALASIALGWRNLRHARSDGERSHFMALGGLLTSLFFLAVIVMQGIPNLLLEPCQ